MTILKNKIVKFWIFEFLLSFNEFFGIREMFQEYKTIERN
jgi:hypothetical protein